MYWFAIAKAAIVVLFGAVAVLGGVRLVEWFFSLIDKPSKGGSVEPGLQAAAATLRGGAWIGALERLSVYVCLIAGFPAGIAVVVAMKGLARYPELKVSSAGAGERFIIGTFISLLLGSACAGLALWLIGLF